MKDWTGSTEQMEALRSPCPYCLAAAGEECHQKGDTTHPLRAFPAHEVRLRRSREAAK